MSCRFVTDAQEIHVRYTLLNPRLEMAHMPATGVSGVDLYVLHEGRAWRWIATAMPSGQRVSVSLIRGMAPGRRTYMLYLPLYNVIDSLDLGVPTGGSLEGIPPRTTRPLVFYGTSIMHGACASRPGMAIPAILGRRLNVPTINLGFSGNGRLEPEVGTFLTEIDAAVYVLDCLPNLTVAETAQRTEPMVLQLRKSRPTTPIVLVEDRVFPNSVVLPEREAEHQQRHAAARAAYERLVAAGVRDLYYLEGINLLGQDGDATVDGSHPTDVGMMRYADAYERILRPLLAPP
jgi:lysophospholipase L1-like esterase